MVQPAARHHHAVARVGHDVRVGRVGKGRVADEVHAIRIDQAEPANLTATEKKNEKKKKKKKKKKKMMIDEW